MRRPATRLLPAALALALAGCGAAPRGDAVPVQTGTLALAWELGAEGTGTELAVPLQAAGSVSGGLWIVDQGAHQLLRFDSPTGPPLRIGRNGAGPGEFRNPAGVVVDGDRVGVLDGGNARFQWLSADGTPRGTFPTQFGEEAAALLAPGRVLLFRPSTVLRDGHAEGRSYLAYVYDEEGYTRRGFGTPRPVAGEALVAILENARAVAVGGGSVLLADMISPRVVRHRATGEAVDTLTRPLNFVPRGFSRGFTMAAYMEEEGARSLRGDVNVGAEGRHHMADPVTLAGTGAADGCFYFLTMLDRLGGTDGTDLVAVDVLAADGRLLGRHRVEGFAPASIHVDDAGYVVLVSPQSATVRIYRPTRPLCAA